MLGIQEDSLEVPADMLLHFVTSYIVSMATWWLEQDMMYSPQYMARQLAKLITRGPLPVAGITVREEE